MTYTFSVPQNEDLITDASVTQPSLVVSKIEGTAAKQSKFECWFLYLVCNTDVVTSGFEKVNGEKIRQR